MKQQSYLEYSCTYKYEYGGSQSVLTWSGSRADWRAELLIGGILLGHCMWGTFGLNSCQLKESLIGSVREWHHCVTLALPMIRKAGCNLTKVVKILEALTVGFCDR